jgi:hypothetical protein
MIIFTATLSLIITVVVALAGAATSSGSIHSLGGHFVLSGHQLSSLSAGKLFPSSIVVRIAGLLGFSMLLGPASGVTAGELVDDERFTSAHISTLDSLHFLGARATLEALMAQLPEERTSAAGAGSSCPASQL